MKNTQRFAISLSLTLASLAAISGCSPAPQEAEPTAKTETPGAENRAHENAASETADTEKLPVHQPKFSDDAFLMAAHDGNMQVIEMAIKSGTEIDVKNERGHNALHLSAYNGHSEIVKFFLQNKIDINERDSEGKSALIHAASGDFPETVELLIDNGADVNLKDETEGFTALMMAAAEGQMDVVKVLLKHGADKTMKDVDGDTAEVFARNNGHFEIADLLADKDEEATDEEKGSKDSE
ncbi:ankyrin repeat-containing protein [Rhodopirellula maiorica SM1]|uniref:Ankyrin repeat-containing protein n=1 Tax=Rhodopirellula maiorica SM1 TaxID=1265738 RepID=M5R8B0_9BACT|nr:ankyrin repeat domain-containing protein [Rhodopirellula maiorica]EMI15625.1 ankyrin repeat-containing protein [Rhodopirellula maiorica SM1]